MKLILPLLLFSLSVRAQHTHTLAEVVGLRDSVDLQVPFYERSPKMTSEDQMVIQPGAGHLITWHEFAGDIDSNKIFCEIFRTETDMFRQRGLACFWLTYQHRWESCDCEPIDSARLELQARYKYDKEFQRREDSIMRAGIERFEKNYKAEEIKTNKP